MTTNAYIVIAFIIFWGALGAWMIWQVIITHSGYQDNSGFHYDRGDGSPLLKINKSQWPELTKKAMKEGKIWGQCPECGAVLTVDDIETGVGKWYLLPKGNKGLECSWHEDEAGYRDDE